ncbi:hypothetical protein [Streptomyces sp. NPDC005262]|uniref:hypothetical protein n=1 Tax=Streptomyces sp. NPDC005262 TaxID=3364710 RepID=UPI0036AC3815
MSYDLAVCEGERPAADDRTAGRVFTDLYDRYLDSKVDHPPTERSAAYVAALQAYVTAHHRGRGLLHHVNPRIGLREDDFRELTDFARPLDTSRATG